MKNKSIYFVLFVFLTTIFYSCKDKIIADFSYEPVQPKIGETVTFTNLSDGGDDFDWTFTNNLTGSVGRSILKNPTRTFTVPGEYSVTLRVDSNKNFIRTKNIYVYDSIPNITRNKQKINYYETVTFSTIAYNPYGRAKTYQWFFSENANGESLRDTLDNLKVSNEAEPVVFYSQKNVEETVSLRMTIGDSIYTTEQIKKDVFIVNDIKSRSLLMAQKDGKILRQRIFERGTEKPAATSVDAGTNPYYMVTYGEQLFIFDAGSSNPAFIPGSIRVVDLKNDEAKEIINNSLAGDSHYGFYNGYVDAQYVYWTDYSDFLYRIGRGERDKTLEWKGDNQHEVPYYITQVDSLGYFGNGMEKNQYNGGIYLSDNTYYWAKGGSGKGLYRFVAEDINKTETPALGSILNDYAIRAFVYDQHRGHIYFSSTDPVGFYAAVSDGTNVRLIDDSPMDDEYSYISGITLDLDAFRVYWAYRAPVASNDSSGVKYINLITSPDAKPGKINFLNYEKNIYGIALDNVVK